MEPGFLQIARLAYLAPMELLASTEPSDFICWFFPIWGLLTIWISRGDNTPNFDIVTCKELRVVDKDGKLRINASTSEDGQASVQLFDNDGKLRIDVSTFADGQTSVRWLDKDGKLRIKAGTRADGRASVYWFDKDGELRIDVSTSANGEASVRWFDKDGETRINAGTLADGTVVLPTEDRKKSGGWFVARLAQSSRWNLVFCKSQDWRTLRRWNYKHKLTN